MTSGPWREGKEEIDREVLSKVPWLCLQGGFFPQVDHLVPPDVSFENYLHYARLLRAVVEDPERHLAERGNAASGKTEPAAAKATATIETPLNTSRENAMRAFLLHVLMTVVLFFAARGTLTATNAGADLDKLIGQPADVAPSAYQYRCDRPAADNPPESVFLFTALKHNKAGALCGLLWEEPRPVRQVCARLAGGRQGGPQARAGRPPLVSRRRQRELVVPGGRRHQAPRGR